MSAQYKPYRDEEESLDGLETTAWTDNEPGSVHIYEKTTEELPFGPTTQRNRWIYIGLFILNGLICFSLGYFGSFHQKDLINSPSSRVSERLIDLLEPLEDPTIKDKIIEKIDGHEILSILKQYNNTNRTPGSDQDHEFAREIQRRFVDFGFDPVTLTNNTFKIMLPRDPTIVRLMSKDGKIVSNIDSENVARPDITPYLPLSQAQKFRGNYDDLMYLNKGSRDDFAKLKALGLNGSDTEGKILIIRQTYHQVYDVVINAQDGGAKAVLLFPDPDIYGTTSPFPESVQLPNDAGKSHPTAWNDYGDLKTMNISHLDNSEALKSGYEKVHIPIIPISFDMARKLLLGLSGVQAPMEWNCFDFTLHLGPGYRDDTDDKRKDVYIEFNNEEKSVTTTTVTGIIAGSVEPDRYIIVGSRRDSLNRGLLDSVSGTAVMLEIARVYASLYKQGWRPRRTIIFTSFGAESFNLIGSSSWIDVHQRLLHSRAVAYLNCDLVVTGNQSISIAASPLLYQVLYNATKQVDNPNVDEQPHLPNVYDAWLARHQVSRSGDSTFDNLITPSKDAAQKLHESSSTNTRPTFHDMEDDEVSLATGNILRKFNKSATIKIRPKLRRLDLHSIYSPFFLYAGIPVVDVRYAGFSSAKSNSSLLEDTMPLLGTKYDNLATVQRVDPHLKYHVAVTQVLSEILRDLSDSVYLPFNLLDYVETLIDSYVNFVANYGKFLDESGIDLVPLRKAISGFRDAAMKFHQRQDRVGVKDPLKVRKFNDQLMLLERSFLDSGGLHLHWEHKHIILPPNDGEEHKEGFPGLVDWLSLLETEIGSSFPIFLEVFKLHYTAIINSINNAIKAIDDVHML